MFDTTRIHAESAVEYALKFWKPGFDLPDTTKVGIEYFRIDFIFSYHNTTIAQMESNKVIYNGLASWKRLLPDFTAHCIFLHFTRGSHFIGVVDKRDNLHNFILDLTKTTHCDCILKTLAIRG